MAKTRLMERLKAAVIGTGGPAAVASESVEPVESRPLEPAEKPAEASKATDPVPARAIQPMLAVPTPKSVFKVKRGQKHRHRR